MPYQTPKLYGAVRGQRWIQAVRGQRWIQAVWGQQWIQAIHGWPGIHCWPGYGGPSMDSATPYLHKGHIFGSIKLVALFFCAHLRTHSYGQVIYNYCNFFPQHFDIQNCISNLQF